MNIHLAITELGLVLNLMRRWMVLDEWVSGWEGMKMRMIRISGFSE